MTTELTYQRLPFAQAIAYLRGKVNIESDRFDEIWQEEHDWAFTIAKSTGADVLVDARGLVDRALVEGRTLEDFQRDFRTLMIQRGWLSDRGEDYMAWKAKTVYETNLRVAYAAGRYAQMTEPDVLRINQFWQWIHGDSRQPRPSHLALDGKIFRADDPGWATNFPPDGYGCKCFAVGLSQEDVGDQAVETLPEDGSLGDVTLPDGTRQAVRWGPDPGWAFAPGASLKEQRQTVLQGLLDRLPSQLRAEVE